ncbi:MAG: hypothetical protein KDD81_10470, partial [Rhodobacteraceae bacterium]|nr:hypothetical protein [Paracoccaceae bacterium]
DTGRARDAGQGLKRGAGRSMFAKQSVKGRHPDAMGANEAQPRQSVIFRGGWGEGGGVRKQTFFPRAFASFARPKMTGQG